VSGIVPRGFLMEYLGEVETITNDGKIVIRAIDTPSPNAPVFDHRERRIGTVKRIFGPVDSPYVTVAPSEKTNLNGLLNKKTYHKGENKNVKGKRRY